MQLGGISPGCGGTPSVQRWMAAVQGGAHDDTLAPPSEDKDQEGNKEEGEGKREEKVAVSAENC